MTVLSYYGQQRRERAGAAACALPGVAGEGGIFTEDILRGMTVSFVLVVNFHDAPASRAASWCPRHCSRQGILQNRMQLKVGHVAKYRVESQFVFVEGLSENEMVYSG